MGKEINFTAGSRKHYQRFLLSERENQWQVERKSLSVEFMDSIAITQLCTHVLLQDTNIATKNSHCCKYR